LERLTFSGTEVTQDRKMQSLKKLRPISKECPFDLRAISKKMKQKRSNKQRGKKK